MNKYTIYCTEEQTKKALELGAPITHGNSRFDNDELSPIGDMDGVWMYAIIPTAEQMIGWLEEQEDIYTIEFDKTSITGWRYGVYYKADNKSCCMSKNKFSSRKEATLAAIDAALEYLTNNKK